MRSAYPLLAIAGGERRGEAKKEVKEDHLAVYVLSDVSTC